MFKLKICLIQLLSLLILISSYDLPGDSCTKNQQSPISISTSDTKFREERYFRILTTNYTSFTGSWQSFPEDNAIGFKDNLGGYIQFIKNWSIYQFNLVKIVFRYNSGHLIDNQKYNVEMELIHKLDNNFRPSGRYIAASSDTLVISMFFNIDEKAKSEETVFFSDLNIKAFAESSMSNVDVKKKIVLNKLVNQQPGFFYEGTMTNVGCEKAWRLVLPKYQYISISEANSLRSILSKLNFLDIATNSNSRVQQPVLNVEIYRSDLTASSVESRLLQIQYDGSMLLKFEFVFVLFLALFLI